MTPAIGEVAMSRPVYAYPFVAQYDGQGDPADVARLAPYRMV
jgi:hypothetical protein